MARRRRCSPAYARTVSTDAFDDLVAAMDGAMVVVTVAIEGERGGCLVGFHSQASIDPAHYAVWLSDKNRTCRLAQEASHLGVHLLGAHQHDLAEHFGGQTGDEVDKLAAATWTPGPGGVPLLDACPSRFVGRIIERTRRGGDHVCMLLEVVEAEAGLARTPLRLRSAEDIDPGHGA